MRLLRLALVGLALAVALLAWQIVEMRGLRVGMHQLEQSQRHVAERLDTLIPDQEIGTMSRTQNWTSGGQPYSWTVTKGDAETQAAYDARCIAEWAEQMELHKPD